MCPAPGRFGAGLLPPSAATLVVHLLSCSLHMSTACIAAQTGALCRSRSNSTFVPLGLGIFRARICRAPVCMFVWVSTDSTQRRRRSRLILFLALFVFALLVFSSLTGAGCLSASAADVVRRCKVFFLKFLLRLLSACASGVLAFHAGYSSSSFGGRIPFFASAALDVAAGAPL